MSTTDQTTQPNGSNNAAGAEVSLRDYFAAEAMLKPTGRPSSLWQAIRWAMGLEYKTGCGDPASVARAAYLQADAMIAARSKA